MTAPLALLLRLDARRLADAVRRPRVGVWAGFALPAALVVGGVWLAGDALRPDVGTEDGRTLLGVLVSGPIAFQAYPILFRPEDDSLLRRLGIPPAALFAHRALRLLLLALAVAGLFLLPFIRTGEPLGAPAFVAMVAAGVAWAASLATTSSAAARMAAGKRSPFRGLLGPDAGLASAASLVFAPIGPLVAGSLAPGVTVGSSIPLRLAVIALLSGAWVAWGVWRFREALPRFAPLSGELAYAPPPAADASELVIGRGLPALLPRRAGAVRARDAVVVSRRFRWAGRLAAPVGIIAALALLRAGGDPEVRRWVATACAGVLVMQSAAVIALGRAERSRLRWIDRALGLRTADRLLGRWAVGFGLSMGVVIPVAFVWSFAVDTSPAWPWVAGAALGALAAAGASLAAAGR
ncbi:MAG TPA: hypothetical protein VGB92_16835 [Longimicrobium sp.]|jgi:hypothetical protein